LRAGWSDQAATAIHSHTGSLAGSKAAYTALFRRHRVIQVDDIQEALDAARIASIEADVGKRVSFISVSGGMGSLAADRCADVGLELGSFEETTRRRLKEVLPSFAPNDNPLDVTGAITSSPGLMSKVLEIVAEDANTDVIVALITVVFGSERIAEEIAEAQPRIGKPVMAVISGGASVKDAADILEASDTIVFRELHAGMLALSRTAQAGEGEAAVAETLPGGFFDDAARKAISEAVAAATAGNEAATLLTEHQSKAILQTAGVPICEEIVVATPERAVEQAQSFGFPVVLKGVTSEIGHKAKAGLVKLNICNEEQVARSYREIEAAAAAVGAKLDGVLVQPMLLPGVELLIGAMRDPQAGPLVAFGLGGVFTESLHQITFRPAPVSEDEAAEMVSDIPACVRLLEGKPERLKPLVDALVRVSNLIADVAAIEELDINPFIYYPRESRGVAVDGLIRCAKT
jgi:acetyltransferase